MNINPLLSEFDLPLFSKIKPEHVEPAVKQLIQQVKRTVDQAVSEVSPTWDNLVEPISKAQDQLSKAWAPVSHLNNVNSQSEMRAAHDACLPLFSELSSWMAQHSKLYTSYETIAYSKGFKYLLFSQQKLIKNTVRDYKLAGVALAEAEQQTFAKNKARLSKLSSTFSNNILDATKAYTKLITDEALLAGLPEMAKAAARQRAIKSDENTKEQNAWLFTLDMPSFQAVMTHCDNRALREEIYEAYVTRASECGPNGGKFDNTEMMNEILVLRQQQASLLGFDNYTELSLQTRMANSPDEVVDFLEELANKSHEQAKQEFSELAQFANNKYGVSSLQPWDIAYYAEKLKSALFSITDELLKPYFPEHKVVAGLFKTVNTLFGIRIEEQTESLDSWHQDVRYFKIFDANNTYRGSFYLDLYARAGKRGGAWMAPCRCRAKYSNGNVQTPIAFLTCNFNSPIGDAPALFNPREVRTLFHEFGHGLHHILTLVDEVELTGTRVARDAVELPSQFLENWCWQQEALADISGHYETGEPLPADLLDKMLAAKNFQSGMQMVRQLEFGLFDFKLHNQTNEENTVNVQQVMDEVRAKVSVTPQSPLNRFQNSFQHIFAGGYAAGYYGYKWSEVLSADAFSRFEQEGIFNQQAGADFLTHILETGGSKEPIELYKMFRGRTPTIDALIRHCGITNS